LSAGGLSPAELVDELCTMFGAYQTGMEGRVRTIHSAVRRAYGYVWGYASWAMRHRYVDLAVVAGQDYTVLPTDFAWNTNVGDFLVDSNNAAFRAAYVAQQDLDAAAVQVEAGSTPTIYDFGLGTMLSPYVLDNADTTLSLYTIDNKDIGGVITPVVRWVPTPTTTFTAKGFQYFIDAPALDMTSISRAFPDDDFDLAWAAAAKLFMAQSVLVPVTASPFLMSKKQVDDLLADIQSVKVWRGTWR
jgi:hypothetical protein